MLRNLHSKTGNLFFIKVAHQRTCIMKKMLKKALVIFPFAKKEKTPRMMVSPKRTDPKEIESVSFQSSMSYEHR